ncbi:MAG: Glycosyltransferase AglJ [Methanoregulaceae archaeon PtaB.Bin108]|nr:MAG: Glycosyltransferase AglJ [Methanoregulaceae archaeon PtaB.Bin108]
MYPDDLPDIQFTDPDIRFDYHEATSMIERYSAFEDLLNANSAKGLVMPGSRPHNPRNMIPVTAKASASQTASLFHDPEYPKALIAVIPAYNEELTIGTVVLRTRLHVDHVIVVDDGSTDRTASVATLAGAEVLQHPINLGKAQAMFKGFARAREYNPLAVVMLDADGQHNPDEIPELLKPVLAGKADLVVGSRFLNGKNDIPAYRIIGQKTLDLATNAGTGTKSTDTQSGFRVLGRRALLNLDFYSEGYNIESDMLSHFAQRGLTIGEVPIGVSYAVTNGHKKNPISHGLDVLSHIIGLVGYRRPLISFGVPGGVLTVIGVFSTLYSVTELYTTGDFHSIMFIGGITSLVLGLLLVTTSLILNSLVQIVKMDT